jgi:hypothetical protein
MTGNLVKTGHNTLKITSLRNEVDRKSVSYTVQCRRRNFNLYSVCECGALDILWHRHLGSFFLDLEDVRNLSLGTICNFIASARGAHDSDFSSRGTRGLQFQPKNIGTDETSNPQFNSFFYLKNKINSNRIYKLVSYLTENTPRDIWCPSKDYCENFFRFFMWRRTFWYRWTTSALLSQAADFTEHRSDTTPYPKT